MGISGIGAGMPKVSSGASSKMNAPQAQPKSGATQGSTAGAQTLKNSLSSLDSVGKNPGITGKGGKLNIVA
ncbi:MAG: hypothetical protein HQM08_19080 [Candidatus Riflebacteria bacterium]|nr:hypothetical protein [Candidatus Riflebacteria bacterium]